MNIRIGILAAALSASAPAAAANITWANPVDATGNVSDVLNYGSVYTAVRSGASATVNGVTFIGSTSMVGGTISFGSAPVTVSGFGGEGAIGAPPPASWDAGYQTLLSSAAYGSTASSAIQISGLTAGKSYLVQLFMPYWNNNWGTSFVGGVNSSATLNMGVGSLPAQSVTGTFIADGSGTQIIDIRAPNQNTALFDAMSIQAAPGGVPEPMSWVMMLSGFGMLGITLRRKERATRSA